MTAGEQASKPAAQRQAAAAAASMRMASGLVDHAADSLLQQQSRSCARDGVGTATPDHIAFPTAHEYLTAWIPHTTARTQTQATEGAGPGPSDWLAAMCLKGPSRRRRNEATGADGGPRGAHERIGTVGGRRRSAGRGHGGRDRVFCCKWQLSAPRDFYPGIGRRGQRVARAQGQGRRC
ncbi:uncharacterized protein BKA78DRAFT_318115 [Phyllosticta capitalensis]|uniref:uncharacterized protein n=1 Tax=Phyllosticta capitalensis TaxID=121624 RepID=UPI00312D72CE